MIIVWEDLHYNILDLLWVKTLNNPLSEIAEIIATGNVCFNFFFEIAMIVHYSYTRGVLGMGHNP